MSASEAWSKVEVLVHRTDDGRLETDRSTLDRLSSIKSPVHVVAVAGPYRTGKSFLLNSIIKALFGRTNVFPIGNTVQALTKGVTIWCSPHPSVRGHWIIFLDTEGLSDVEKGDRNNDMLIFVLTVLLSSTLIYNSRGVIDFHALETIHHVSVLAEKIRLMPDLSEDLEDIGFDLAFPELLWVVRDFHLNLKKNGTCITDDEYLEDALSTSNMGLNSRKSTVVSVKRCIKEYFAKRKCFLLPNLLESTDVFVTAGSCQRRTMTDLIDQVAVAECKMHQGSEVTGRVLGKLAEELVEECQRLDMQEPVNVQAIMDRIAEKENSAAAAKSLELYQTEMGQKTVEAVDEVTLHQIHFSCSERATTNFMHAAVYPVDSSFIKLMRAINLEFDKITENNSAKVNELCKQTFTALRKELIGDSNTKYFCSGGFQKYREDMTELRKRWEENPVLQGVAGRNFFGKMMSKLREGEAQLIMNADKSMTEIKREEAAKRHQEERKHLEELKKQKEETSVDTLEKDRNAFQERMSSQVGSAILRPHEAEISKLNCRIAVLDRELQELRERRAEDEADTCEQRLKIYQRMLREKQNQPSGWQKVSSSIHSFARGAVDSIRKLFRFWDAGTAPHRVASPDASLPSALPASPGSFPAASRASSHVSSSVVPVASSVLSSGRPSESPVASTTASPVSSSTSPVAASASSPGSSSTSPVAASASSPGSSSTLPVAASASSPVSSSTSPVASNASSPGSSPATVSVASSVASATAQAAAASSALPVVATMSATSSVSLSSATPRVGSSAASCALTSLASSD